MSTLKHLYISGTLAIQHTFPKVGNTLIYHYLQLALHQVVTFVHYVHCDAGQKVLQFKTKGRLGQIQLQHTRYRTERKYIILDTGYWINGHWINGYWINGYWINGYTAQFFDLVIIKSFGLTRLTCLTPNFIICYLFLWVSNFAFHPGTDLQELDEKDTSLCPNLNSLILRNIQSSHPTH